MMRRRLSTLRPALVAIRFMNPCSRERYLFLGWKVRLGIILQTILFLAPYGQIKSLKLRQINNILPLNPARLSTINKSFPHFLQGWLFTVYKLTSVRKDFHINLTIVESTVEKLHIFAIVLCTKQCRCCSAQIL